MKHTWSQHVCLCVCLCGHLCVIPKPCGGNMTDFGLIAAGLCALHRIMTWVPPNVPFHRHEVCDQKRHGRIAWHHGMDTFLYQN